MSQQPSRASKTITQSRQAAKEAREYIVSVSLEFQGAPLINHSEIWRQSGFSIRPPSPPVC